MKKHELSEILVTAYIPISLPSEKFPWFELPGEKKYEHLLPLALKEIKELTGVLRPNRQELGDLPIQIDIFSGAELPTGVSRRWSNSKTTPNSIVLRFQKLIPFSVNEISKSEFLSKWTPAEQKNLLPQLTTIHQKQLADLFRKSILDLLLTANLAKPGALQTLQGLLFINNRFYRDVSSLNTPFAQCYEISTDHEWPSLRDLPVQTVWDWISQVPGFEDGMGIGPLGRAMAALTYLVEADIPEMLIWGVIGLEALYGRDNLGVKSQILEKSEVLLGKRYKGKKKFGWMYDFRSRLLHGDIDFPVAYDELDARPEPFQNEVYEAALMATTILLATLQEMATRKLYILKFSSVLDEVASQLTSDDGPLKS
ncbi:MAG: hypothetical protein LLH30_05290 [Candidatus Manganitrophus sp. SA1]|nr:hypothetical protein [Candidatus Manganitrophus morganii]